MIVSGTLAYVTAGSAGLRMVDVSDPTHPAEIGAWDSPGYAYGVAASGTCIYKADGWNGLLTVNVADPRHPVLSGLLSIPGWVFGVALSGTRATMIKDAARHTAGQHLSILSGHGNV